MIFIQYTEILVWSLYAQCRKIECPYLGKCDNSLTMTHNCVVYQAFAGCQVYEMEQRSVLEAMEKEGIPIIYLESDYSPSHLGQLTTRIEAFVESIKNRKRKR